MDSPVINFYLGRIPANNKKGYKIREILEWSDYKLEKTHDFIQWLFPDKTGGVNDNAPKLGKADVQVFRTNKKVRKNVVKAVVRMLRFYGYEIGGKRMVRRVQEIKRNEKGDLSDKESYVGLYSEHNYQRLTRMMIFLNKINMGVLSSIIMLALCRALHEDVELREKVRKSKAMRYWLDAQPYLREYAWTYDISEMGDTNILKRNDGENGDEDKGGEKVRDSKILKIGGGDSDVRELSIDPNTIIVGIHTGIMKGKDWTYKKYWKELDEKLGDKTFKIIIVSPGSTSWLRWSLYRKDNTTVPEKCIVKLVQKRLEPEGIFMAEGWQYDLFKPLTEKYKLWMYSVGREDKVYFFVWSNRNLEGILLEVGKRELEHGNGFGVPADGNWATFFPPSLDTPEKRKRYNYDSIDTVLQILFTIQE